ncbi:MAG: tetratricopeptide repeat protein [Gammaproteobacteria bacterium]|nr:tetratricopeptide repeat protein [Gammaproteobacteria bacterium]
MSFINGSSIMNRVSIGAVSLVLLLSACSSNEPKEEEFAMPESVMVDLEGGDATTAAPAAEAAAAEDDAAAAGAKKAPTDQDSAAVLERLRTQSAPVTARDPAHEKQAKAAREGFDRALVEMKKGNLDGALAQFRQLSAQYPALAGPVVNQAIILRKKGQLDAAHKLLQDGLMTHGRNPYYLNQLGIYSRELGQFRKAQASYESAIRIDENYAKAHYNLAVLADLYLHDPALALREFQTYQKLLPEPDAKVAGWIKDLERRQAP